MLFKLKIFRFCAEKDYNEYYQNLNINIDEHLSLKDLMREIQNKLDDFVYDKESFGFRINGLVVFNNIKLLDLREHFGDELEIDSICAKYAKKDLLINKDEIYQQYKAKLDKFSFLNEESKNELKKYILINLIYPFDLDDYVGDGYAMYIKWMCIHYQEHKDELLESISKFENGVINSISTKDMIYPSDNSIDKEIESIKKELFNTNLPYIKKIRKENISKYKIIK